MDNHPYYRAVEQYSSLLNQFDVPCEQIEAFEVDKRVTFPFSILAETDEIPRAFDFFDTLEDDPHVIAMEMNGW